MLHQSSKSSSQAKTIIAPVAGCLSLAIADAVPVAVPEADVEADAEADAAAEEWQSLC